MADYEPVEVEQVASSEGQVWIEFDQEPDIDREAIRERLVRMFTPEVLRVKNAQGELMPYGVEVVQCKICGSLMQRGVSTLLVHARHHEQEGRVARRAPRRARPGRAT